MKKVLVISLLTIWVAAWTPAQQRGLGVVKSSESEVRVALVIGNSAYRDAPLMNPVNDARDIAQALTRLGFEVIHREDLSQSEMKRAIRAFGEKIRGSDVSLFYYAGHGIQVNGENYLVPVDATINHEVEVEYEAVDLGLVLAQMEQAKNRVNIVILDACRNNPFARSFRSASRGLASVTAPGGTLIAYATAPGSVAADGGARNGLYTQELLKNMLTPALSIEEVFKRVRAAVKDKTQGNQIPWESSSLIGDFYFVAPSETIGRSQSPVSAVDPTAIELSFWETIKNSHNPEDFRAYLQQYPNGRFAALARIRAEVESSTDSSRSVLREAIAGKYEGIAKSQALGEFPIVLELKDEGGRLSGEFDTPQGPAPIISLAYANSKLLIEAEVGGARITFSAWYRDGRIIGEYEGAGVAGTIDLKRVNK
jgi:hypothetical protein